MPKVKTHSAAKKRFKRTAGGKLKRSRAFRRHHAWAKSSKQVRDLRGEAYIDSTQLKKISRLMPY
jgi:large subunit ribosomal protein L35